MDKLRYIDELLKTSLGDSGYATSVSSDDWLAIEKRLKRRKNRIYAMWFSLSLVVLTSLGLWITSDYSTQQITENSSVELQGENTTTQEPKALDPNSIEEPQQSLDDQIISDIRETTVQNVSWENEIVKENGAQEDVVEEEVSADVDPIAENNNEVVLSDGLLNEYIEAFNDIPVYIRKPEVKLLDPIDHSKVKRSISHMEFGVSITPSFASKLLSEDSRLGGLINKEFFGIVNNSEQAAFATNTHFNGSVHFNNGWYIGIGVGYVQRTEAINYNYVIDHFVNVNEVENKIDSYTLLPPLARETITYQGSNSYHFVDIPVRVGYRYNVLPKWSIGHELAVSYMLLVNQVGQRADPTYLNLYDISKVDFYNKANIGSSFKTGLYYNFKNFVVGAEPVVGMNLNSLSNKESAIKIRPYNYGFNLTTQIKIGKK